MSKIRPMSPALANARTPSLQSRPQAAAILSSDALSLSTVMRDGRKRRHYGSPTAQCQDGTDSYSKHSNGACSDHGGVATWLDGSVSTTTSPVNANPVPPAPIDNGNVNYVPPAPIDNGNVNYVPPAPIDNGNVNYVPPAPIDYSSPVNDVPPPPVPPGFTPPKPASRPW